MDVVINLLNSILSSNRSTSVLDLEFSQLTSLTPLLPYLSQFKSLKQLSLHGNRLIDLPEDLSSLSVLEELDITNNLIQKVDSVIFGLKTLKNLRKLSLNVKLKDDENLIIREIPSLEFLNGEKISRKAAINTPKPQNSIPPLFQQTNEQEFQEKPQVSEEKIGGITQEELEALSNLYDVIREVHKEVNSENDQVLAEQFDEHVRNILGDLKAKINGKNNAGTNLQSLTIKAKYALYEICFSKFMSFLEGIDPRLANILENLHDSHALIFKEMSSNYCLKFFRKNN